MSDSRRWVANAWSNGGIAIWISLCPPPTGSAAPSSHGTVIEVDFGKVPAAPKTDIVEAEIVEHINLNSSRSGKETIHLALAFEGGVPAYEPGDSLDIYPENDPAEVDDLLRATGLANDQTLRAEKEVHRLPQSLLTGCNQCVSELETRTHTRAIVCSCTVRFNSEGKLKRTSSSLISTSSNSL